MYRIFEYLDNKLEKSRIKRTHKQKKRRKNGKYKWKAKKKTTTTTRNEKKHCRRNRNL